MSVEIAASLKANLKTNVSRPYNHIVRFLIYDS